MEPIKAFIICPDAATLQSAIAFLKEKEFDADGVTGKDEALAAFGQKVYDMVIISGGIDNKTREVFRQEFTKINKEFEFVEHFGKPEDMLPEMKEAFESL